MIEEADPQRWESIAKYKIQITIKWFLAALMCVSSILISLSSTTYCYLIGGSDNETFYWIILSVGNTHKWTTTCK